MKQEKGNDKPLFQLLPSTGSLNSVVGLLHRCKW